MPLPEGPGERARALGPPETECGICCESFDGRARRPKLLACHHQVCARCLRRMAEAMVGKSPSGLCCPFCRQETDVPDRDVARLPDNQCALARLPGPSPEVLLCPAVLEPPFGKRLSSDCLVITLLEVPEGAAVPGPPAGLDIVDAVRFYRPPSLASSPCRGPLPLCQLDGARQAMPRCLLGLLGLVYFSSLPLGIYLLLVERPSLGLALVSLVPSTLLLGVFYGLCHCLCQDIFDLPSSS